jgi:rRNA maturation protein Nop10
MSNYGMAVHGGCPHPVSIQDPMDKTRRMRRRRRHERSRQRSRGSSSSSRIRLW